MSNIKLFQEKQVRSVWNEDEHQWYFSIVDVVSILTDSADPKQYIKKMRSRDKELNLKWGTICTPVAMLSADGKKHRSQAANVKGILRIIQSIPSPKAEPFKLWLAQVGSERLEEIEDPELIQQRMIATYKDKGYSDKWIEARLRGIATRNDLTQAWKDNGLENNHDYAILTAEISRATFGITPSQHKAIKNLTKRNDNLRDNMTNLELLFTALGEASTAEIEKAKSPHNMIGHLAAAFEGGHVAGNARKELEAKTNKPVVSSTNYKEVTEIEQSKTIEE